MPLDAAVLTALQNELAPALTGARIDKIAMPERDLVLLSVHTREGSRKLLISARSGSARMHFTTASFENPPQPPMFCMLLRKHLAGGRITGLEQPRMERMLLLRVDAVDELDVHSGKTLAIELMGKGVNLILIDGEGRIIDCLRRVDYECGARRAVLPGLFYELPPVQERPNFYTCDEDTAESMILHADRSNEPDRWLMSSFAGLSPLIAGELAVDGWEHLAERCAELKALVARGAFAPTMLWEKDQPRDFSFMPISQYGDSMKQSSESSFSELLDRFYIERDRLEILRRRGAELTRLVRTTRDRQLRKLAAREQELSSAKDRETYRRRGDLITANIYRLKKGMTSFETQDFYDPACPTVTVMLDGRKTPQQNAAENYKLYTKARTAEKVLQELIRKNTEEAAYLDSVLDELERSVNDRDLSDIRRELIVSGFIREKTDGKKQKLPAPRKPLLFHSPSGKEVLVGRGNTQNDELTFKLARRTDLWFHVLHFPGSHVILSQAEGEATEEDIAFAASLAVTYSRASGGGRAAVDYTQVRMVKKPGGALPGRVIYSGQKTVLAEPLKENSQRS